MTNRNILKTSILLCLIVIFFIGQKLFLGKRVNQINEGFACAKKITSGVGGTERAAAKLLGFEISLDKQEYSLSERIPLKVIFQNTSNEGYYIAIGSLEGGLIFRAKDGSAGEIVNKSVLLGRPGFHGKDYYYLLKKNENMVVEVEFNKLHSVSQTGRYQITAEYWNCTAGNKYTRSPAWEFWKAQHKVWIGGVESNAVSVNFVK